MYVIVTLEYMEQDIYTCICILVCILVSWFILGYHIAFLYQSYEDIWSPPSSRHLYRGGPWRGMGGTLSTPLHQGKKRLLKLTIFTSYFYKYIYTYIYMYCSFI